MHASTYFVSMASYQINILIKLRNLRNHETMYQKEVDGPLLSLKSSYS